jgi:four helix bundle protein
MRNHKSLLAWQRANAVVKAIIHLSRVHYQPWADALFRQIQRSSLSVQLNIAEGYAHASPRQFRRYLTSAYASAVETAELLTLLTELEVIPGIEATSSLGLCAESQALTLGLLRRSRRMPAILSEK